MKFYNNCQSAQTFRSNLNFSSLFHCPFHCHCQIFCRNCGFLTSILRVSLAFFLGSKMQYSLPLDSYICPKRNRILKCFYRVIFWLHVLLTNRWRWRGLQHCHWPHLYWSESGGGHYALIKIFLEISSYGRRRLQGQLWEKMPFWVFTFHSTSFQKLSLILNSASLFIMIFTRICWTFCANTNEVETSVSKIMKIKIFESCRFQNCYLTCDF